MRQLCVFHEAEAKWLIHIGFNMMSLMQFGPALEELYGSARYLFLYVFTGAFGFFASALTGHFSLGASGALLGLVVHHAREFGVSDGLLPERARSTAMRDNLLFDAFGDFLIGVPLRQ